jgi:hypothetical protein
MAGGQGSIQRMTGTEGKQIKRRAKKSGHSGRSQAHQKLGTWYSNCAFDFVVRRLVFGQPLGGGQITTSNQLMNLQKLRPLLASGY